MSDNNAGPSRSSLEETFRELADEELIRRCSSGELTELAQAVALEEVRARGLALPTPVVEEEPEPEYQGDWVIVARYLGYTEVNLQRAVLEGNGIPAVVADAQLMQTDGLLKLDAKSLEVLPAGRLLVRNICMVFDHYLKGGGQNNRFSKVI